MLLPSAAEAQIPGCAGAAGLKAEFYEGYYFGDQQLFTDNPPFLTRIEPQLNYFLGSGNTPGKNWGEILPAGIDPNPNYFSARFRGGLYIAQAGTYKLYLGSSDASYLWLDNDATASPVVTANAKIQNGGTHAYLVKPSVSVYLAQGIHPLLIHFGDYQGADRLTLEYESTQLGIPRQTVPNQILCSADLVSMTYSPQYLNTPVGTAASSSVPTLVKGGNTLSGISLVSPPNGISINSQTGVITATVGVPAGSYRLHANVTVTQPNGSNRSVLFNNIFTVIVSSPAPPGCQARNSGEAPKSGVYAEYYAGYFDDDQDFFVNHTPSLVRTEYQLNFYNVDPSNNDAWGSISPPAGGSSTNPDLFSARYQGTLHVATAGTYTFHLGSDDAIYLWVGPAASSPQTSPALIANGGRHTYDVKSGSVVLSQGPHEFLVHYGERLGYNQLTLEYEGPGISKRSIPNAALCSGVSFVPLPVDLLFFRATARTDYVALDWATLSETHAAYFTVERSTDGQHFEAILRLDSRNGESKTRQNYSLRDTAPKPGTNYYRLRTVDQDGTYTTSKMVAAAFGKAGLFLQPNPVSQVDLSLLLEGELEAGEREVGVYTIQGMQVYQATFSGEQTQLPTRQWPAGLYIVRVKAGGQVFRQRVVVQ